MKKNSFHCLKRVTLSIEVSKYGNCIRVAKFCQKPDLSHQYWEHISVIFFIVVQRNIYINWMLVLRPWPNITWWIRKRNYCNSKLYINIHFQFNVIQKLYSELWKVELIYGVCSLVKKWKCYNCTVPNNFVIYLGLFHHISVN